MTRFSTGNGGSLTSNLAALQQRPRPLPLFLAMLRSETAADSARLSRALAGLRAYQQAPRALPPEPMPAIAEAFGAALRDYGGEGPPLVVIPSLINPPHVLDLPGERSLLRWLSRRGRRVLLLDWGEASERTHLSVAGHVEQIAVPLIEALGERPALAGYCLGGTMAAAAAALTHTERLIMIAGPWHFAGYGEQPRVQLAALWAKAKPVADRLGVLPMEALQSAFWSLDPARTIAKFEAFAELDPDGDEARNFVTLEDWANDGPPIPAPAAREMFEDFFAEDLPGRGQWQVGSTAIDPRALPCPVLDIVSTTDRIVPSATAAGAPDRIELALGHVGMIVGSRARAALWEPLASWLSPDTA